MARMVAIVCGSRDWKDYAYVEYELDDLLYDYDYLTVVEGGARGADTAAWKWAVEMRSKPDAHVSWVRFDADWKQYGRAAGHVRNKAMLDYLIKARDLGMATRVLAFKDNFDHRLKHGGTENMVKIAREAGFYVEVHCHD